MASSAARRCMITIKMDEWIWLWVKTAARRSCIETLARSRVCEFVSRDQQAIRRESGRRSGWALGRTKDQCEKCTPGVAIGARTARCKSLERPNRRSRFGFVGGGGRITTGEVPAGAIEIQVDSAGQ